MINIKVREYLRNEKYYFIPTKKNSEYLAVTYDICRGCFVLQRFRENENLIGKLEPNIYERFILNKDDMEVFIKTLVLIWRTQNTENFNVMEDILQKIDIKLLCKSVPANRRNLHLKLKAKDITYRNSFGVLLDKSQCQQLYSVVRHIKAENNLV